MLTGEQMQRLMGLRTELTNTIGFYCLIDDDAAKTPIDAMLYEVHFKASAMKTATELLDIINEVLRDLPDD